MRVVDAHLHVWDPAVAAYPWLPPDDPLSRRVDLDEVQDELREAEVDAVVLVQAADSPEDTAHMVEVADRHPIVAGIVAWVPLDDAAATERALGAHRADRRIVGVRNLTHDRPDPDWLLRPDVGETAALLAERGIPLDVVTNDPSGLRVVASLADRHPRLRLVIDHLGKPEMDAGAAAMAEWRALLGACAEHPDAVAKLSGFRLPSNGGSADIRPFVDDALRLFGPSRLLAGSDWPLGRHGGYAATWRALHAALEGLGSAEIAEVLGGTAERVYGLTPPS